MIDARDGRHPCIDDGSSSRLEVCIIFMSSCVACWRTRFFINFYYCWAAYVPAAGLI